MAEVVTREQEFAQKAYTAVVKHQGKEESQFRQAAVTFPSLLHNNGLCQAVSFYQLEKVKVRNQYLADLAFVLGYSKDEFVEKSKNSSIEVYMHLTQLTMQAASWLKRYAQALLKDDTTDSSLGGEKQ